MTAEIACSTQSDNARRVRLLSLTEFLAILKVIHVTERIVSSTNLTLWFVLCDFTTHASPGLYPWTQLQTDVINVRRKKNLTSKRVFVEKELKSFESTDLKNVGAFWTGFYL